MRTVDTRYRASVCETASGVPAAPLRDGSAASRASPYPLVPYDVAHDHYQASNIRHASDLSILRYPPATSPSIIHLPVET